MEDDVLSKIVETGEPELLTDISRAAEADVIRYYDSPQGIRSFAGAPVFYNDELIAILAIDSKVEDVKRKQRFKRNLEFQEGFIGSIPF